MATLKATIAAPVVRTLGIPDVLGEIRRQAQIEISVRNFRLKSRRKTRFIKRTSIRSTGDFGGTVWRAFFLGCSSCPTGGQPQQQQISQLAHLAQLAQLSQLNAQYNLGFDLSTLNQLAAMNMPPSNPHPDDAAAQALRQLQAQGMFPGANPDASNAVPTFPFPQLPAQPQSHQQPYMQSGAVARTPRFSVAPNTSSGCPSIRPE